jgi:multiple sugar transport system substrate-binding protein
MRKKLLVAAITLTAGLVLSGCSGQSQSDGPTTITFWNSFTSSDRAAVEEIVKRFNESQDEVKVDMTIQPGDVHMQKLLPAYSAGKGPTIASLDASQLPGFAELGVLSPVDDLYEGGLDADELPEASLEATMFDDEQYGVPMAATNSMLYYNKTLFAEAGIDGPPQTMDELAEDAVALTNYTAGADSSNTYGFLIPDREAVSSWAVLLWSLGGGITNDDNTASTFGDEETIAAMKYWNDLIQNDHITPVGMTGVDADTVFGAGRGGMYINGPWAAGAFTEAGIDFDVAPIPAGDAGQFSNAVSVNMHLNADVSDAERDAAYDFFEFWNSPEQQTYWAVQTSYPPNLTSIPAEDVAENPVSAKFTEAVGGKFYLGGLAQFADIDANVVVPTIQRITNNQGTPEELLPKAADDIDKILSK